MLSRACRHKLGLTVGGACSAARKPYSLRLQTTRPKRAITSRNTASAKPEPRTKTRAPKTGPATAVVRVPAEKRARPAPTSTMKGHQRSQTRDVGEELAMTEASTRAGLGRKPRVE